MGIHAADDATCSFVYRHSQPPALTSTNGFAGPNARTGQSRDHEGQALLGSQASARQSLTARRSRAVDRSRERHGWSIGVRVRPHRAPHGASLPVGRSVFEFRPPGNWRLSSDCRSAGSCPSCPAVTTVRRPWSSMFSSRIWLCTDYTRRFHSTSFLDQRRSAIAYDRCFGRTVRLQAPVLNRVRSAHQELSELGLGRLDDLLVRSLNQSSSDEYRSLERPNRTPLQSSSIAKVVGPSSRIGWKGTMISGTVDTRSPMRVGLWRQVPF